MWAGAASGETGSLVPDLLLLATPAGASRFAAWQLAKSVETYGSIGLRSYVSGGVVSGAIGTGLYVATNLNDLENLTLGNLAITFGASAIGSGIVRRELNTIYGLRNTSIPFTLPNLVTHASGAAVGYGALGWMNSTNLPVSGTSVLTQPVWPNPISQTPIQGK